MLVSLMFHPCLKICFFQRSLSGILSRAMATLSRRTARVSTVAGAMAMLSTSRVTLSCAAHIITLLQSTTSNPMRNRFTIICRLRVNGLNAT